MSAPARCGFAYDFSIWYCPDDHHVASSISEYLRKKGFQGYAEHQDQVAGTSVVLTAAEAIRASRVAILLLSAKSLEDPWCQRVSEWNLHHVIHHSGTKVIPVYVGVKKEEVPLFLQHLNQLEYQTEFFFERLLRSLARSRPAARGAGAAPKAES